MNQNGGANGVKKEEPLDEDELDEQLWGSGSESDEEPSKTGPYKIHNKLRTPVVCRYSCESLFKMIVEGDIDLEAPYQRGVVWRQIKQSAVIDSIIRHFYVPPVLLSLEQENKEEDPEGREIRVCVDGKQGIIPVREGGNGRMFYYKGTPDIPDKPGNKHRRTNIFTDAQRKMFDKEQITAVEYSGLKEKDERDMFQRVQMGMILSPAEKLAASTGHWPEFCHELEKRYVEEDLSNPRNKITFRHLLMLDRGKDFLFMAQICLLILNETEVKFIPHAKDVQAFFDASGDKREVTDLERSVILKTMTRWVEIANDADVNGPILPQITARNTKKTMAPVEFVFAAFMVRYFNRASNRELVNLISGFMSIVREKHPGNVFFNTKVEKTTRMYMRHQERLHPNWVAEDLGILSGEPATGGSRRRVLEEDDSEFVPNARELYSNQRRRLD